MKNFDTVNSLISSRQPCTSFEDNTYYNMPLFEHFCENRDYKYVAIFGYYKIKYNWTDEQAQQMYDKAPDGWKDGLGVYRLYDWGKGENKIECGKDGEWHEPQLDHITPKKKAQAMGWPQSKIDHPDNMQVLPANVNRILNDLTDEEAPAIIPIILEQLNM